MKIHCDKELEEKIRRQNVDEHALILMNHHTELDWLYAWTMGDRMSVLGNCRAFAKDSLKYIPIVGWAWALSDMIFLKRDWETDKLRMMDSINKLLDYPSPTWILLFPEGTRFNEQKHLESVKFAEKSGLPVLRHHLTPRTKGFSFIVKNVDRSKLKTIYDVTMCPERDGYPFNLNSILTGNPTICNIFIKRIPIENVSKDLDESAKWLQNHFKEKDDLKNKYLTTGQFKDDSVALSFPPNISTLMLLVLPNLLVLGLLVWLTATGGWLTRLCLTLLMGVAMLGVRVICNSARLSKSSHYGSRKNN